MESSRTGRIFEFVRHSTPDHPERVVSQLICTDTTSLGLLIRRERKAQNLTQVQLAGLTGVGVRFLRELEGGKPSCQIGLIFKVAAALGIAVSAGVRRERTS